MIIEFSVRNFRSIKGEQVLGVWTTKDSELGFLERLHAVPGSEYFCLPTIGIYGANAAGKSNLLKGLKALSYMVYSSTRLNDDEEIPYFDPFRLAEDEKATTTLEVEYSPSDRKAKKVGRYRYTLEFGKKAIKLEKLIGLSGADDESLIFKRGSRATCSQEVEWGVDYADDGKRLDLQFLPQHTLLASCRKRPNVFLELAEAIQCLGKQLTFLSADYSVSSLQRREADVSVSIAKAFLPLIDVGVKSAFAKPRKERPETKEILRFVIKTMHMPEELMNAEIPARMSYYTSHLREDGKEETFKLSDESDGTQKMFAILPAFVLALCTGETIVIDEIERSMHPFMAALIIKLFNDPEVNAYGAQLLYTTHDTSLMDQQLLRKDQIWFAEKDKFGASRYFSLNDFDSRQVLPTSPFVEWYVQGRFGGIPMLDYPRIAKEMGLLTTMVRRASKQTEGRKNAKA